jgi:hypothetical protein
MFGHSSLTQTTKNQILQKHQSNQAKKCHTPPKQMHDLKLSFFATKAPPYTAHPHSPKGMTSKCSAKLQSISTKHRPNNEECKTKIHDLHTTSSKLHND